MKAKNPPDTFLMFRFLVLREEVKTLESAVPTFTVLGGRFACTMHHSPTSNPMPNLYGVLIEFSSLSMKFIAKMNFTSCVARGNNFSLCFAA